MPVGTAGACRRIQLMVRLADIDSYAIGGRRNTHCTLTVYVAVRSIARLPLSET